MSEISISIHSLRVEGDIKLYLSVLRESISIHSLRVEGDQCCAVAISKRAISIHSLRVEGDKDGLNCISTQPYFNPLPPCGGRLYHAGDVRRDRQFQSTPSVWRETGHGQQDRRPYPISIHSLRVEGDPTLPQSVLLRCISIHSLRVEGDIGSTALVTETKYFNPLPPCGGRPMASKMPGNLRISIHSLRVEGDSAAMTTLVERQRISIHSLRVEGDRWRQKCLEICAFQSTPSVWRETPLP